MSALSHSQKSNSKENRKAMLWRPCFSGHWNVVDSWKNPLTQHKQQLNKHSTRLDRRVSSVQSLSRVLVFLTPWTAACQASLSITNSQSLLKLMSNESVMPSNHLILYHPLLLRPLIFLSIKEMSQLFASVGQSIGASASASVLPMNTQDWSPLVLTGWISLLSKGLLSIFSNTTVQKHQFFGAQLSL